MSKLPSTKHESLKALAEHTRRIREEINAGYRYAGYGGEWSEPEDQPGREMLDLNFVLLRKTA